MEGKSKEKDKVNYQPAHDSILRIGSQDLIPIGDHYRFVIKEIMPEKGFKFKFGIRDRIIKEMTKRGKRLAVRFSDAPELEINMNHIDWFNKKDVKKQKGMFKDPMTFYWYYVDFNGNLVNKREKQPEGQQVLL